MWTFSVSAQAGGGAVVDSGISVGTQYLTTGQVDPGRVLFDGTVGAVAGGAGPALGDLGSAAVSRLRGGAEDITTLYRNVDAPEFDSIATTGRFELGPGAMEESSSHRTARMQTRGGTLERRARSHGPDDRSHLGHGQMRQFPGKYDGIGPAVYAYPEQVDLINRTALRSSCGHDR